MKRLMLLLDLLMTCCRLCLCLLFFGCGCWMLLTLSGCKDDLPPSPPQPSSSQEIAPGVRYIVDQWPALPTSKRHVIRFGEPALMRDWLEINWSTLYYDKEFPNVAPEQWCQILVASRGQPEVRVATNAVGEVVWLTMWGLDYRSGNTNVGAP